MKQELEKLKKNWKSHILFNNPVDETRGFVSEAWDRCIFMNVDYNDGYGHRISDGELKKLLEKKKNLIDIARPVMENIFEIIKQTSFSLVLTDENGVIIHLVENENIHLKHNSMNFVTGTRWDEKSVGANAIGTALARKKDTYMKGAEHFCISHHAWTCSAALIRDGSGEVIGCLDISGSVEDDHIHTFGVVTTAARIIEKQLDLMGSCELMDIAFNAVLEGLFVLSRDYEPTHMNDRIVNMFEMDREEFQDLDFRKIFKDLDLENTVFFEGSNIRIGDYSINLGKRKIDCLINVSPIKVSGRITGAVILVKEAEQVRKVISSIMGFRPNYTFDDIITDDPKVKKLIEFAKKISRTNRTVLIQGESGTGKEIFAHSIHSASSRSNGPFIVVNCAALPKELVESELFGYEKGAFTGASSEGKPGKFELADKGTIFLDEIGELPVEIQSKLLRILENQKVSRIGGRYERNLDVRIIAATNRNLREEVEMRSFREDLFFRLNVINITLIPLRDRKGDILLFADHFLKELNGENSGVSKYFSEEFKDLLANGKWRGNVRELKHFIQREYYLSDGEKIERFYSFKDSANVKEAFHNENMKHVEKMCIIEALKATKGNVLDAAERLKIGKSTVYRKVKTYNINVKSFK
ncbi:Transcriptional regulator of acetoin/glycerol metabolism [Dethiosulfatibacter aminovorans DSM 17477]|uniref:Transcriptional regulator of acetoin/glycerol metabolism n=1 Tax=Dethiosulfatibacter aminovorans DSM 17477 TaxID=1121476 RepID=A0A1M6F1B2_9FIRM|nr:sigma 54-interacting transcriptional regulator [Dethiosulfatibacter aminovorans]SHI91473.1 Transcriptional regulator of acetoin/glycerol metabolism [Dethiosulfatibacter aminovorans DSM 17477]